MPQSFRFLLMIFMGCALAAVSLSAQTDIPPHQREGADHADKAREFFERLHSVPEGFNWRIVNQAVRDARTTLMERISKGADHSQNGSVTGTWRELGSDNQCGRIVTVDYDAETDRVWVAGAGGTIWAGDINGTSWTILNETQQIDYPRLLEHVTMPDGTLRLIAVAQQPRSYFLDEGETVWQLAAGQDEWQRWGNVARAVSCRREGRLEIYAMGSEWDYSSAWKARGVLWRSIDSGASYQRIKWFDGMQSLWTDGGDNVLLLHGDSISAVHPDGTLTYTNNTSPWRQYRSVILAGSSIDEIMLSMYNGSETLFTVSDDMGATWTSTDIVTYGPFDRASFARTLDPSQTWLYGGVEVSRSEDYGTSWTRLNSWGEYYANPDTKLHADIPAIVPFTMKDGRGLTFICTDGGIYTSTDGGITVRNISLVGLNTSQYYGSYTSRDNVDVVGAGAQDQGFQRSRVDNGNGPRSFEQLISGDYARLVSGDDGHTLWCVYPGSTWYYPDFENGGAKTARQFAHRRGLWLPPLAADPRTPASVYLGGGSGGESGTRIYRYDYAGSSLMVDSLTLGVDDAGDITAIEIAREDPNVWYVATTDADVFVSTDAGAAWTRKKRPEGLDGHYFGGNALTTDPDDAKHVYIGGQGYNDPAVWHSTDGGDVWNPIEGLPPCLVLSLAVSSDGSLIAAATDAGAYIYDVQAGAWTDVTILGAPDQYYWHVDFVPPLNSFRFSTYGRGLWEFVPGAISSVREWKAPYLDLHVDGVVTPEGGGVRIMAREPGTALLVWYDVDGRELMREAIALGEEAYIHRRPSNVPGGSMVVVTDTTGRVGAALAP